MMDGLSVVKVLYGFDSGFNFPSILLTVQDPAQYTVQAEALGYVRFVEKQFEIDAFLNIVRELIQ